MVKSFKREGRGGKESERERRRRRENRAMPRVCASVSLYLRVVGNIDLKMKRERGEKR